MNRKLTRILAGLLALQTITLFNLSAVPILDTLVIDSVICDGLLFELPGNQSFDYETGNNDTLIWQVSGADSTLIDLHLQVFPSPVQASTLYETCHGDTLYYQDIPITRDTIIDEWLNTENGCDSLYQHRFWFANPQFAFFNSFPEALCQDDTLTYIHGEDFVSNIADRETLVIGDSLALPDGTGAAYESSVYALTFPESSTISSANELELCINMEHSWMYDLDIELKGPDGTEVILQLQQFIVNEVHLGIPYENDDNNTPYPPTPGIGSTYCWNVDSSNVSWTEYAETNDPGSSGEYLLPAGTYAPHESFDAFLGKPWNGKWTLRVIDQWGSDNGWIFYWVLRRRAADSDNNDGIIAEWISSTITTIPGDSLLYIPGEDDAGFQTFTYNIQDTLLGCGHEAEFNTFVHSTGLIEQDTTICPGSILAGSVIDSEGIHEFEVYNPLCGFSTIRYDITLSDTSRDTIYETSCRQMDTGTFNEYYINTYGCDSLITRIIEYTPPTDTTFANALTCIPSVVGTYYDNIFETSGCDSLVRTTFVYHEPQFDYELTPDTCITQVGTATLKWLVSNPLPLSAVQWYLIDMNELVDLGTGISQNMLQGGANYLVEIEAGPNCILQDTIYLETIGSMESGFLNIQNSIENNTVHHFNAYSGASDLVTYEWKFFDGSILQGDTVSFEYDLPGIYPVIFNAYDLCWEITDVILPDNIIPIINISNEHYSSTGDTLTIPAYFTGAYQLDSLIVTLNSTMGAGWSLLNVLPSQEQLQSGEVTNLSNNSFSWKGNTIYNFENGDTLCLLQVLQTPEIVDSLDFHSLNAQGTFLPAGGSGFYSDLAFELRQKSFYYSEVEGQVVLAPYHINAYSSMDEIDVNLFNDHINHDVVTSSSGKYNFPKVLPNEQVSIKAVKNGLSNNDLSTEGILQLLAHINGVTPLSSPYQIISGDVNCSLSLDTFDVLLMQDVLMGNQIGFGTCPDWTFIPESFNFPNPNIPFDYPDSLVINTAPGLVNADRFFGIKRGDILGEATLNVLPIDDTLFLNVSLPPVLAGDIVDIPFTVQNFDALTGFQLQLEFNTDVLSFEGYTFGNLPGIQNRNVGLSEISNGTFQMNWYQLNLAPTSLVDGTTAFSLHLKAETDIDDINEYLSLSQQTHIHPEAYDKLINPIPLVLNIDVISSTIEQMEKELILYPNEPNPFQSQTDIPFYLPISTKAVLQIIDMNGKIAHQHQDEYANGYHRYSLDLEDRLPAGVYSCVLITEYGRRIRKLIVGK